MEPQPPPIFIIPGMHVGCMPYDALIESNLECFFNSTCLNMTVQLISNLSPSHWPKPLNNSVPSQYLPNETIKNIYRELMSEKWEITKNFSTYYSACAPDECTYTYVESFDLIRVITVLVGLFGGASVALRIMSPFIVRFGQYIHKHLKKRFRRNRHQQGMPKTLSQKHLGISKLN